MRRLYSVTASLAVLALLTPIAAQQRDRATIPDIYKWDLTPIYASTAAWRAAKDQLDKDLPGIRQLKGTLGRSPAALADALERVTALRKTYFRIATYASLRADEDTRIAEHQGMRQEVTLLGASYGTEVNCADRTAPVSVEPSVQRRQMLVHPLDQS